MRADHPIGQDSTRRWTRRQVLSGIGGLSAAGLGLAGLGLAGLGLAGCTASRPGLNGRSLTPGVPSSGTLAASPTASPAPSGALTAATRELGLTAHASAILSGALQKQLSADQRRVLAFVRDSHSAHAAALADPLPSRPTDATGSASLKQALAELADRERAAAAAWRRSSRAATGLDALLWGSLTVAALGFATALGAAAPPPSTSVSARSEVVLLSEVEAVQEVVRQLHALVYGYQMAIGRLPVGSAARTRAVRQLLGERRQRDSLIDWLIARSAAVPAAEPAYVPSVVPRDASTAGLLIRRMQTAFQPFCGIWLAAAESGSQRRRALAALEDAYATALGWGARLAAWPGYST